uniref:CNNM transmembrane domain-containing protein n=1 Tax=Panagrellus redivivus TaxID=6233 RepID=A0A7E4VVE1_PANRE
MRVSIPVLTTLLTLATRHGFSDSDIGNDTAADEDEDPYVAGINKGEPTEYQRVKPRTSFTLALFGENLENGAIGEVWLTDADRCVDTPRRRKIPLTIDDSYADEYVLLVKSGKDGLPNEPNVKYRLCLSEEDDSIAQPSMIIMPITPEAFIIPLFGLIIIYVLLLGLSAMFSGLNLAYSCQSIESLTLLVHSADPDKAKQAASILPLRRRGNWLISTFSVGNVIVNIIATLVFEQMVVMYDQNIQLIILNTAPVALTMVFGEIVPQTICYTRALKVASFLRHFVYFFMVLLAVLAWPISKVLDFFMGHEYRVYDLRKLEALLETHAKDKELLINVLNFPHVTIGKVMTRIQEAYLMSRNDVLDMNRVVGILEKGYTRVPVYEGVDRKKIVAVLNIKDLILVDPDDKKRVFEVIEEFSSVKQSTHIRFVSHEMTAQEIMNEMIKGRQHLMMVFRFDNKAYTIVGLVTLEDIIEQFIGEIKDDDDAAFPTMRAGVRRDQSTFDWFRSEVDRRTNLTANELLHLMEQIMDQCPVFGYLNFNTYAMRALICVSNIERVENRVLLEKGAVLSHVIVIIDGSIAENGIRVTTSRPVIGNDLLHHLYTQLLCSADSTKIVQISMRVPEEIVVLSQKATVMYFELKDIYNILLVLQTERLNEDPATQFDFYMHIMAVMGEMAPKVDVMRPSMEEATQKVHESILKEAETAAERPKEITAKSTIVNMDPKDEQKTQGFSSLKSSRKARPPSRPSTASSPGNHKKTSKSKISWKKLKKTAKTSKEKSKKGSDHDHEHSSPTTPGTAKTGRNSITDKSYTISEDDTQKSVTPEK